MYFYCFFSFEYFYPYDHYAACWVTSRYNPLVDKYKFPKRVTSHVQNYIKDRLLCHLSISMQTMVYIPEIILYTQFLVDN